MNHRRLKTGEVRSESKSKKEVMEIIQKGMKSKEGNKRTEYTAIFKILGEAIESSMLQDLKEKWIFMT